MTTSKSLGRGSFSWSVIDELDGNLTNNTSDNPTVLASGTVRNARYRLRVRMEVFGKAYDVLKSPVAAGSTISVQPLCALFLTNGPATANSSVTNQSWLPGIFGDVNAESFSGFRPWRGDVTTGQPDKPMPGSVPFETYKAAATAVAMPSDGVLTKNVLTAGYNPYGAEDPKGVYYIDTGGRDLTIKGFRLDGTLVIRCKPGKVTFQDRCFFENTVASNPTLLVDGNLVMSCYSFLPLREDSGGYNTNFNPPGAPYKGATDSIKVDWYPNIVRGLTHVLDNLTLEDGSRSNGAILCEGKVTAKGWNWLINNPNLFTHPPAGYSGTASSVRPASWSRIID